MLCEKQNIQIFLLDLTCDVIGDPEVSEVNFPSTYSVPIHVLTSEMNALRQIRLLRHPDGSFVMIKSKHISRKLLV